MFMTLYLRGCRGDRKSSAYYAALSAVMCEELGYLNSEVYTRSLCYGFLSSACQMDDLKEFHRKVKAAQNLPYHYIMTVEDIREEENSTHKNHNNNNRNNNESEGEGEDKGNVGPVRGKNYYVTLAQQHSTLAYTVAIAHTLLRMKIPLAVDLMRVLVKRIKGLFAEWSKMDESQLKPSQKLMATLLFAAVTAEIYHRLGNRTKSLLWAMMFLSNATHPLFGIAPGLFTTCFPILEIFAGSADSFLQLDHLLAILRPLKDRLPMLGMILQPYENKLASNSNFSHLQGNGDFLFAFNYYNYPFSCSSSPLFMYPPPSSPIHFQPNPNQ
jgi:hypothetical protein